MIEAILKAVSYTHLDVYKRQLGNFSKKAKTKTIIEIVLLK